MKLDSKGEMFWKGCAVTELMVNSDLQEKKREEFRPPVRRGLFPITLFVPQNLPFFCQI